MTRKQKEESQKWLEYLESIREKDGLVDPPEVDYMALGRRIRAERKRHNLTQKQLSEMSGISESFLGFIERGQRVAAVKTLTGISNALDIPLEELVFGDYKYEPKMLPGDILASLNAMNERQRKAFLKVMKLLGDHSEEWKI